MKYKLLLFLTFCLLQAVSSFGSHMAGGDIAYRYLGNEKYLVTFKAYRDCKGGPLSAPDFELKCLSSTKVISLSATRISIRDISPTCAAGGLACNPQNTTVTALGFEEHVFTDTIDFNGNAKDLKSCCSVRISMGDCCRSNAITTGGAGSNFLVTSDIDLCKNPNNSSPVFSFAPDFIACCNQPARLSFNAHDTIDGDSLSYRFVKPLHSYTDTVVWKTGRNYKSPMSDYWPQGYDKNKGPNPNVNPPIGTYLDPQTGIIFFTPTDCSELTKMAVAVREWRKDSTGTYKIIGEIIRDIAFGVITCPDNNAPLIYGANNYKVCEGEKISINFQTDDKQFMPSPPNKPRPPDTTSITWDYGIKGASFEVVNDSDRLKTGRFTWIAPKGVSTKTYYFTIKVTDNACPRNAFVYRTVGIKVTKLMNVNHEILKLKDNVFVGKGSLKSAGVSFSQIWKLYDSTGVWLRGTNIPPNEYSLNHILRTSPNHNADTFEFLKNGKYFISHSLSSEEFCPKTIFDTIVVKNIPFEVSILSAIDTSVCKFTKLKLTAKVTGGKKPYQYKWKKDGKTIADTIANIEYDGLANAFYEVEVTDSTGQTNSTYLSAKAYPLPNIRKANDTLVCSTFGIKIKAKPLTRYEYIIKWEWTKDGMVVSTTDSLKTNITGTYVSKALNNFGCFSFDTFALENYQIHNLGLKDGVYCQNKNELKQNEIIQSPSDLKVFDKLEWTLLKSLKDTAGLLNYIENLVKDIDNSSNYDFRMKFGKDIIDLATSTKDSLKFILTATDKFKCLSLDTMTVILVKSPEIVSNTNQSYCRNDNIDLTKTVSSNIPMKMNAENHNGYDVWPSVGEISKGLIAQKYFKPEGGKYLVRLTAVNDMCIAKDSVNLTINPNPIPLIRIEYFGDSAKYIDESKYATTRKWYVNTVFKTSDKELVLNKSNDNFKTIRLELGNTECSNDTSFIAKLAAVKNLQSNPVKIYPNPANYTLTIQTTYTKPYQIRIFNALGQMILIKQTDVPIELIAVDNLTKGAYTIEVMCDGKSSRVMFIKN